MFDHLGVGVGSIDGVSTVHEEQRALPAEVGLDLRVGDVSLVEEVGCCDSDGVGGPQFEVGILVCNVWYHRGAVSEMRCQHGCGDVLFLPLVFLKIPRGLVGCAPMRMARRDMQREAWMAQQSVFSLSRAKSIFCPFSLLFFFLHSNHGLGREVLDVSVGELLLM